MTRALTALVIVLSIALCIFVITQATATSLSLDAFVGEYMASRDVHAQQAVATAYLKQFSVEQLNAELEQAYPLSQCHTQGHGIGRAVYASSGSLTEAVQRCAEACNYGCFHGAMMEMFSTDSDTLGGAVDEEDPEAYMKKVRDGARELCASPDVTSVVLPAFCSHGVGHIFAVASKYDLRTALGACSVFHTRDGSLSCAAGVFMEYSLLPGNAGTIRDKGFAICDPFPRYAESCYRYIAPITISMLGGVPNALKTCQSLESSYLQNSCIFGVGYSELSQDDFDRADGIDFVCGSLTDAAQKQACLKGGIQHVVTGTGDGQSNASCEAMDPVFRSECMHWLNAQRTTKE